MSSKDVTASNEEQGEAAPDSVFDFLYHDSRRIGSFLSQFDASGHLTGLTQGESAARGSKRGWKVGLGGELPLLAGAKVELERQPGESGSESMERSYDPFWTNALTFLDTLTERGLIHLQIEDASLGQIVLVKGSLNVLDLTMFKEAWQLPSVQAAVRAGDEAQNPQPEGNRHQRRGQAHQKAPKHPMPSDTEVALDLMTVLPHTVHATLLSDTGVRTWAVLRDEFMVAPASDLVLTHGSIMPGEWAMIGILSGQPDYGETELQQELAQMNTALPPGLVNSGVGLMMMLLSPLIRTTMGRPTSAYAVTPLLVFREVT